jgi:ABC-type uncharacterized transport system permease subunit
MKFFREMFSDDNSINEKSVIGFLAFIMMSLFAIVDIVTGYLGKELVVNEFIFTAFEILVLGSFGIAATEKITSIIKSNKNEENEAE